MGKPVRAVTFTLTGTSGKDEIRINSGHLYLNDGERLVTAGAVKITINGGDGDDVVRTDSPHTLGTTPIFYDGGRGIDTLDFTDSSQAVAVNLYQPRHGSWQQSVATGFSLEPIGNLSPGFYDPADPQKILSLGDTSVQTNNLQNFENVIGSTHDDYISLGSTAGARAEGGAGNDYIMGWSGADTLLGGADNDFLFGKAGNDTMTGGTGADQFQVLTLNGVDVVTDFNVAEGDQLYIGWQQATDTLPDENSWYATTWTDAQGGVHQAIRADFTGGGVIMVDHSLADVSAIMQSTTTFHWFG